MAHGSDVEGGEATQGPEAAVIGAQSHVSRTLCDALRLHPAAHMRRGAVSAVRDLSATPTTQCCRFVVWFQMRVVLQLHR
jgi:hypothetical protein